MSSNRFDPNKPKKKTRPVTLPSGRLRLLTKPSLIGSPPVTKTIGMVLVAAFAANAEGVFPTITSTDRAMSSADSAGSRSL
jgi:hypothetical protein